MDQKKKKEFSREEEWLFYIVIKYKSIYEDNIEIKIKIVNKVHTATVLLPPTHNNKYLTRILFWFLFFFFISLINCL